MAEAVIRPLERGDLAALGVVLEETGLFPPAMLEGMVEPWFADRGSAVWLVAEGAGTVCGFCHAVPEALTEGTWNLLALAVHPAAQGRGVAAGLVAETVSALRATGARLAIVDTAGTEDYAVARRLYARLGFAEVARIPEFWAEGVDKVTYALRL